jgi:hypothetical protein
MAETDDLHLIVESDEEDPKPARRLRAAVSDAFAFVRSVEANKALATVTLEDLIGEVISRYGESDSSNASQYNPYSFDPSKSEEKPAGEQTTERVNFIGGFPLDRPTKLDRLAALDSELGAIIKEIKTMETIEVADADEYTDADDESPPVFTTEI